MHSFDIGKPNKNSQSLCKIIQKDSSSHKFQFENQHQGKPTTWLINCATIIKTNSVQFEKKIEEELILKYERFKKIAWIQSHHLHFQ